MSTTLTYDDLITRLRALVEQAGSQRAAAEQLGISTVYLVQVLSGTRQPGPTILNALGYERLILYTPREVASLAA